MRKKLLSIVALLLMTVTCAVAQNTHTVTLKEGTVDSTSWQGKAGTGEYQSLPLTGVAAGTEVTVKYNGTKKVKSVKAVKKAAAVAEGHALSASEVGEIVCSDGLAYAAADKDKLPQGVTAVAMVAYKSETAGSSLALALSDDYGYQGWTDITSHSPAVTGGTWVLASETQWTQMINAMGSDGLRDGFSSIGGTNLENNYYWSSTPGESGHRRYDFSDKGWYNSGSSGKGYGRACLVF